MNYLCLLIVLMVTLGLIILSRDREICGKTFENKGICMRLTKVLHIDTTTVMLEVFKLHSLLTVDWCH